MDARPPSPIGNSTTDVLKILAAANMLPNNKPSEAELQTAAQAVGPRCYQVTGVPSGSLHFYILGCQGENSDRQKAVAALMDKLAQDKKPAFILH